jgi:uncharacterized protein (DUF58 family)
VRLLTARGRLALVVAAGLYGGSWAFGIREGYVVSLCLALVVLLGVGVVAAAARPRALARTAPGEHVEGEPLQVEVALDAGRLAGAVTLAVVDGCAGLGRHRCVLERRGRAFVGRWRAPRPPRGRHRLDDAELVVGDVFGLACRRVRLASGGEAVLVLPRVVELVAPAHGADPSGGRGAHAAADGFDLRGVRDHAPGESLRRVHWRSTARAGRLMVKELHEPPRAQALVVLDARQRPLAGRAPDTSFELQVRTAASLLHALVAAGRPAALVIAGAGTLRMAVSGAAGFAAALERLATVRPEPGPSLLASASAAAGGTLLVTAEPGAAPVDGTRGLRVVWIDGRSFGDPGAGGAEQAEALERAGATVVRIARGDDLRERLALEEAVRAAH